MLWNFLIIQSALRKYTSLIVSVFIHKKKKSSKFLQNIHPQPSPTVTNRPPPLWMTPLVPAFHTQTRALEKRAM